MERYAPDMAKQIGSQVMLVEYGSGSSVKTRLLLDHLPEPAAYVPVDISRDHLHHTAQSLARAYPHIEILPVCADFTSPFSLPASTKPASHVALYFPGSTIGNFTPDAAEEVLTGIAARVGRGGGLLIGVDLKKDPSVLEAAYDDSSGVTAEFNLNLLRRINRELDADIDIDQFRHEAIYNEQMGRVEISLVSRCDQAVTVDGRSFSLVDGEKIRTEYSHKYEIDSFAELASRAGLELHHQWTDAQTRFAVLHLVVTSV